MEKLEYIIYNWFEFIRANRIVGVFLIALAAFICLITALSCNKLNQTKIIQIDYKKATILLLCSCLSVVLLLIPFTALLLMKFQTVFYSYRVLWLLAPILPITAIALTLFATYLKKNTSNKTFIIAAIATAAILIACGSMGTLKGRVNTFDGIKYQFTYKQCSPLLEKIEEYAHSEENRKSVTILAPENITAYARMYSGDIHTLYGKDMWDDNMKPYTYNNYPSEYHDLFTWINCTEIYGSFYNRDDQNPKYYYEIDMDEYDDLVTHNSAIGGVPCAELAIECGVDIIVVYSTHPLFDDVALNHIVEKLNLTTEYVPISASDGYTLIYLTK